MGSRAHGSAAQTPSGSADPPTGSTPAASHMQSPVTPTNRTAPGPAITPAGPEQPAVLPESHGSRLPPVHIRPPTGRSAFPGTLRFGAGSTRQIGVPGQAVAG